MSAFPTGWFHLPATAASMRTETDPYRFFKQFQYALRDRTWATSGQTYPQCNATWGDGADATATLTQNVDGTWSLYQPGANWVSAPTRRCAAQNLYFGFDCLDLPYFPKYYDAICDSDNEREVVRCRIVAQPDGSHVTLSNTIDDYVTARAIPSAAWLNGRPWKFIKRDGLTWSDRDDALGRWLTWIGDQQVYAGDAGRAASVLTVTPTAGQAWTPEAYYGKTLALGSGGTPSESRTILEGDATRLVTDRFTATPGGGVRVMDGTTVLATGTINGTVRDGLYDDAFASDDAPTTFKAAKVTAKELLVYEGGPGTLRRITLLDGTLPHTLVFGRRTAAVSGAWVIVNVNGCAFPARAKPMPFRWYAGAPKKAWGHSPGDALVGVNTPETTVYWASGTLDPGCPDEPSPHLAFDRDVWSDVTEECSDPDHCYSPRLFKSWRQWQRFTLDICGGFVEAKDYSGATAIPTLTPARLFLIANINHGTATLSGNTTGGFAFAPSSTYAGTTIYYTIVGPDGNNLTSDSGVAGAGGLINVGTDEKLAGLSVIYSAGFTRKRPKHVARFYPSTTFVHDFRSTEAGVTIYDPPAVADFCCDKDDPPPDACCEDCFGVGQYVRRGPSTSFSNYDGNGLLKDGEPFAAGDAARYVGDTVSDTGTNLLDYVEFSPSRPNGQRPDLVCFDRQFEGQHSKPPFGNAQAAIVGDRSGVATSGTRYSFTDGGKDWFRDWFNGSVRKTLVGTLVAGGIASVTLDAWTHDVHDARHCFFDAGRFVGFPAAFADFVIEIDRVTPASGTTPAVTTTYKMPLVGVTNGIATFKYTVSPAVAFQAGDAWRIKEAWKINRYETCRAVLIDPTTSARHVVTVTHSDGDTNFFAPQAFTVAAGWKYEILEYDTGGVWLFATSAPTAADAVYQQVGDHAYWVKPTGNDPRGQPWLSDSTLNEPHHVTRYGLLEKNDYVNATLVNELYRCIDALRVTWRGFNWSPRAVATVPENNSGGGSCGSQDDVPQPSDADLSRGHFTEFATLTGVLDAQLQNNVYGGGRNGGRGEGSGPPYALLDAEVIGAPFGDNDIDYEAAFGGNAYVGVQYAYGVLSGLPTKLTVGTVSFAGYAQIDSVDSPEQSLSDLNTQDYSYGVKGAVATLTTTRKTSFLSYAGTEFHRWTVFAVASGYQTEYREMFGSAGEMPQIDWPAPACSESTAEEIVLHSGCYISATMALIAWNMNYAS